VRLVIDVRAWIGNAQGCRNLIWSRGSR